MMKQYITKILIIRLHKVLKDIKLMFFTLF
jgi:hypothetical protein